mgnify:CR=1 FL=1
MIHKIDHQHHLCQKILQFLLNLLNLNYHLSLKTQKILLNQMILLSQMNQ